MCGGTVCATSVRQAMSGLSPRVRGNLRLPDAPDAALGSIPACAGEPDDGDVTLMYVPVYPRVCGGTELPKGYHSYDTGLSPRVRGNPARGGPCCR